MLPLARVVLMMMAARSAYAEGPPNSDSFLIFLPILLLSRFWAPLSLLISGLMIVFYIIRYRRSRRDIFKRLGVYFAFVLLLAGSIQVIYFDRIRPEIEKRKW